MDMQPGKVRDMRSASATQTKGFSIGSSGFDYARLEDGELPEIEDWTDQEQVKEKYFPKLEALIKERYVIMSLFKKRNIGRGHWRRVSLHP